MKNCDVDISTRNISACNTYLRNIYNTGYIFEVTGMNFKLWLEENDLEKALADVKTKSFYKLEGDYISPDDIWLRPKSETFMYDGELYLGSKIVADDEDRGTQGKDATHLDMMRVIPKYVKRMNDLYGNKVDFAFKYRVDKGLEEVLFGRAIKTSGKDFFQYYMNDGPVPLPEGETEISIISFWNKDMGLYKKWLKGCVDGLKREGVIGDELFISIPGKGIRHISNLGDLNIGISKEESDRISMWEKLHLMKPDEKKKAMADLGLGGGYRGLGRERWKSGLRDIGMPGYLTQSEGLVESFINPNDLYYPCVRSGGCVTFFFMDGEMKKYSGSTPHHNILMSDSDLSSRIEKITGLSGIFMRARLDDSKDVILGRYGEYDSGELGKIFLISLWNKGLGEGDIKVLLRKMLSDGDIVKRDGDYFGEGGERAYLSSREISGYVVDILGGGVEKKEMSDEEKKRLEMWRKLHLMEPIEKKRAMAELGVGATKDSSKGAWRDALMARGFPPYLTQSEGFVGSK